METKEIVILSNFSHEPSGAYVIGEHHIIDEVLANQFIESNLAELCVKTNEEAKSSGRRKKVNKNGDN